MTGVVSPGWQQLNTSTARVNVWAAFGEARDQRLGLGFCAGNDADC